MKVETSDVRSDSGNSTPNQTTRKSQSRQKKTSKSLEKIRTQDTNSEPHSANSKRASGGQLQGSKRGPYRMFPLEMRIKVLDYMDKHGIKAAKLEYNISKKRLMRWVKSGPDRKKGAGRKTLDPEMEKALVRIINCCVETHACFLTR